MPILLDKRGKGFCGRFKQQVDGKTVFILFLEPFWPITLTLFCASDFQHGKIFDHIFLDLLFCALDLLESF